MSEFTYYVTITDVMGEEDGRSYDGYYSIMITGLPTTPTGCRRTVAPRRAMTDDQIRSEVGEFLQKLGVDHDFAVEIRARDELHA